MLSVLMHDVYSIFCRPELSFCSTDWAHRPAGEGRPTPPMLGRFVQVHCNDIFIFSKTREEHLEHVWTSHSEWVFDGTPELLRQESWTG